MSRPPAPNLIIAMDNTAFKTFKPSATEDEITAIHDYFRTLLEGKKTDDSMDLAQFQATLKLTGGAPPPAEHLAWTEEVWVG